jgi:voltage-gated potassium channel Kch
MILVVTAMVIWLVGGLTASAWLWAAIFLIFDVFSELEPALYFSVVTFTTLGYGDVVLGTQWRLLGSLTAVNGLIIVGLNTAFLMEAISQIRKVQSKKPS